MTECDRIIKDKILPESFFKAETICDFFVDERRKKLWALNIDLLLEVGRVCRKYNLNYYLIGGALIGAVRHHGFIPWDDDIDIAMPRKDYEIFLQHFDEFKSPYFLQTPYTDDGYFFAHARLRNSNTTFIQRPFCYCNYNMGVFVDILPLDNFQETDEGETLFHELERNIIQNSTAMKLSNAKPNAKDIERIKKYEYQNPFEVFETIQKIGKSFSDRETDDYCLTCGVVYGFHKSLFEKKAFEKTKYVEFEGVEVPIPSGYDSILTRIFGDYMEFPPFENRGGWHGATFIDVDTNYLDSKKSIEYKKWLELPY